MNSIQSYTFNLFRELLPFRIKTKEGNANFRRTIIKGLESKFNLTHAGAATYYNLAFIKAKKLARTDPELSNLMVGLGRGEEEHFTRRMVGSTAANNASFVDPEPVEVRGPMNPVLTVADLEAMERQHYFPLIRSYRVVLASDPTHIVAAGLRYGKARQLMKAARRNGKPELEIVPE